MTDDLTVIHDPGKGIGFRIERMWAFLVIHDDGDEAVPAMAGPDGIWVPMIAADQERLSQLRPHAESMAKMLGKEIRLVRFDNMTTVETFNA
jgi:hypothetical protein